MSDISIWVKSDQTSSERRISPSWTITTLKGKLERITGIPPSHQVLSLQLNDRTTFPIAPRDEDNTTLSTYQSHLRSYTTLNVDDSRPPSARINIYDDQNFEKFTLTNEEYEARPDTVQAWKRNQKLGRFDPNRQEHLSIIAKSILQAHEEQIAFRHIEVGKRCAVGDDSQRRGTVKYVGPVDELAGNGLWIGVEYDEPVGKNDGSIAGKRYFTAKSCHGGLVRPDRLTVGDYPEEDLLNIDNEEI